MQHMHKASVLVEMASCLLHDSVCTASLAYGGKSMPNAG